MAQLIEYECPCCGGGIEFNANEQTLKCPFCDTSFEMSDLKAYDEAMETQGEESMDWESEPDSQWTDSETEGMKVYTCQSCGGQLVVDETMGASACPYCDSPVVMTSSFSGDLRPDLVIPFQLDKQAAVAALANHLKGKKLLPKVFKDQQHIEEIKGVYVPFWLFDATAQGSMNFRATRTRIWEVGDYEYTETKQFNIVRGGSLAVEAVPVDGSSKLADDLMESLEPYDLSKGVDFQSAYLAGYVANRYDVTADESKERVNQRVRDSVEEEFRKTISGYDTVTPGRSALQLAHGTVRYALYPVWMLSTTWNGEKYLFAMNGQTGKFVGNLPMDMGAAIRWFLGVSIPVAAIALGLGGLLGFL